MDKDHCEICNKSYGKRSRYRTHMRIKHNSSFYLTKPKCPICGLLFDYKSNATVHLKNLHSDDVKHMPADKVKELVVNEIIPNPGN